MAEHAAITGPARSIRKYVHGNRSVISKRSKKRFLRYGLLLANAAVVLGAILIVVHNPSSQSVNRSVAKVDDDQAVNPLDTLSSADIAVTAARMANLPETLAIVNHADSVNAELNTPVGENSLVPKPQVLSSAIKTKYDIQSYTVQSGDDLGGLANKFGVTSDSIKWSNNLAGNTLKIGSVLLIPPINGIVHTVTGTDTPSLLARKYNANEQQIIVFNDAEVNGLQVGEKVVIPGGSITAPVYVAPAYYGPTSAVYGFNGYYYGFCTWYVANRRAELGRPLPSNLGDAWTWDDIAARVGITVNHSPASGAAVVTNSNRNPGHVAIVESVNDDGSVWISEMNSSGQRSPTDSTPAGGWGRVDYKLIPAASAGSYNYIH